MTDYIYDKELHREKIKAGLARAKKKGKVPGRPTVITDQLIIIVEKLINAGVSDRDILNNLTISVATYYRIKKKIKR